MMTWYHELFFKGRVSRFATNITFNQSTYMYGNYGKGPFLDKNSVKSTPLGLNYNILFLRNSVNYTVLW